MHNYVGNKIQELLDSSDKSINDLARASNISSNQWARIINGSSRISVDLSIRLGLIFPLTAPSNAITDGISNNPPVKWLWLQHMSDIENARNKQEDILYRDIKPFGDKP